MIALELLRRLSVPPEQRWPSAERSLQLRRAWPRDDVHVLLEYRSGTGRIVAGQWFADEARAESVAHRTAVRSRADHVARVDSVVLQREGADRRLPGLARLLTWPGTTLVSHRAERRAVVRIDDGDGVRFAKVVRPERTAGVVAAHGAVAGGPVRVPRLLSADADAGVTVWSALPGRCLLELLVSADLAAAARAAGRTLAHLHGLRAPGRGAHHPADERRVVHDWVRRTQGHDPELAALLGPRLADVDRRLAALPVVDVGVVHRDLHDQQVLVGDDGRAGLLDLDTLTHGDPALDLANLLVHLELRVRQGRCSRTQARTAAIALLDGCSADEGVLARIPAYAAATRLRLACVYRFRPAAEGVARELARGSDELPQIPVGSA